MHAQSWEVIHLHFPCTQEPERASFEILCMQDPGLALLWKFSACGILGGHPFGNALRAQS
jgi:hypothetical protein